MAGLVFDERTQRLRRENEARDALLRQLADLNAGPAAEGLVWPAAERAMFDYEQWATARRAEINQRLAMQVVRCHQTAEEARLAFGRTQALEKVPLQAVRKPPAG
jgi:hypothetical protein